MRQKRHFKKVNHKIVCLHFCFCYFILSFKTKIIYYSSLWSKRATHVSETSISNIHDWNTSVSKHPRRTSIRTNCKLFLAQWTPYASSFSYPYTAPPMASVVDQAFKHCCLCHRHWFSIKIFERNFGKSQFWTYDHYNIILLPFCLLFDVCRTSVNTYLVLLA